ncbi:MAG: cell division FtsA domain-containing protein [Minisyncoccia bacterium]
MRHTVTGIDIGSSSIKVMVCEFSELQQTPKVIGTGIAQSRGVRQGYIVNVEEAADALTQAITLAQTESGVPITHAYVSLNGVGLQEIICTAELLLSKEGRVITDDDIQKVISLARRNAQEQLLNRKIVHEIPIEFTVANTKMFNSPVGMKSKSISIQLLIVNIIEQHLSNLVETCESANIEVVDVMAGPLAASLVTVSKAQKIAGAALVLLGSETTTVAVFEDGIPKGLKVLPFGGSQITNELALSLKIPIEDADRIKKNYATQLSFPKKKVTDAVQKKEKEMLKHIYAYLKSLPRNGLLPAGVYMSGGGAALQHLTDDAKSLLRLPVSIPHLHHSTSRSHQKDGIFSTAHGMCLFGLQQEQEKSPRLSVKGASKNFFRWLSQFLP